MNNQLSIISYRLFFQMAFASWLIVIFVYDLKHYLILDRIVFPATALALLYQIYQGQLTNALLGALLLSGFFALLYFVSKGRWIGFGDVKLGLFLGMLAAWPQVLVTFFLAYFLGALIAIPLLLFKQKKLADKLPFGTFLTLAAFVGMMYGKEIISWYLGLIGFI